MKRLNSCLSLLLYSIRVLCTLIANETTTELVIANDQLYAAVNKSTGAIYKLTLDGQDLLGSFLQKSGTTDVVTGQGQTGVGPYLDCYCIPSGFYTPGSIDPKYKLFQGIDGSDTAYGGILMSEVYPPTGQLLEQYWFLRDGETGLHTFSRIAYHNESAPWLRNLQEFRTLFRPNTDLWTHLSTNEIQNAPIPPPDVLDEAKVVQDATWYLGNYTDEPYVIEEADYFTKYTFADIYRDHKVHGLYSDGSTSDDNSTFGAWLVMNTKDTYYGGPLHGDLVVDGIVYNYLVSNHWGAPTPNITNGFDRTFGPFFYYFNKGEPGTSLNDLRKDALQFATPTWNAGFYDSICQHVPNYVPSGGRGTFKAIVQLPKGASRPIAILSQSGVDFQDNANGTSTYQYWADIDPKEGLVEIPMIKSATYRLTIYADGIFGQYVQEAIEIKAGMVNEIDHITWIPESSGNEIWRIGIPDKSSGEYKHGYQTVSNRTNHPEQYRIYWGVYDFPTEFPDGVNFKVGESKEARDLNYIHWSVFGGKGNSIRPQAYYGDGNVNNWTIQFPLEQSQLASSAVPLHTATLTIQLAGAKTAAGNTDVRNSSEPFASLPYTVSVNSHDLPPWIIPWYESSSCGVRSSVICHNLAHKFVFDSGMLMDGLNEIVLSLPYNATDYESAVLPTSMYVQYDALRLELS